MRPKNKLLIGTLLLSLIFLTGCQENTYFIDKDPCREPGTYCHVIIVENGTVNISFPTVTGDLNYTVEAGP